MEAQWRNEVSKQSSETLLFVASHISFRPAKVNAVTRSAFSEIINRAASDVERFPCEHIASNTITVFAPGDNAIRRRIGAAASRGRRRAPTSRRGVALGRLDVLRGCDV